MRKANQPSIYIFGDSFVFGSGVNDEQTFAFLLQQAMPGFNVRLFALGGYSLSQAQLTFQRLKKQISSRDIVVLGYADFYDVRHVVAPSRLREIRDWTARFKADGKSNNYLLPKAGLAQDGALKFSYISQECEQNNGYCELETPPSSHMAKVTAALVNTIAGGAAAKTYLLHFEGASTNPALEMLDKRVTHISALPGAFDYFIRDDVEGFDSHPGPYWHYAMFSKLFETLREQKPERSATKLRSGR